MSIEPAPQLNRRRRLNRVRDWEALGHVADEDFQQVHPPLVELYEAGARRGLEEGWLVEVDTPEGRLIVVPGEAKQLAVPSAELEESAMEGGDNRVEARRGVARAIVPNGGGQAEGSRPVPAGARGVRTETGDPRLYP